MNRVKREIMNKSLYFQICDILRLFLVCALYSGAFTFQSLTLESRSSPNVVLIFESVDKILKCDHSNEGNRFHLNGHTLV